MEAKTNFRQIVNPEYLGAYSLDSGNYSYLEKECIILSCAKGNVLGKKGTQQKIIAQTNCGKPLILNSTSHDVLHKITSSRYFEDWKNVNVILYVETGVRNPAGRGTVDAIRIKPNPKFPNQCRLPILSIDDKETIDKIKKAVQNGFTLEQIKVKYQISNEIQKLIGL